MKGRLSKSIVLLSLGAALLLHCSSSDLGTGGTFPGSDAGKSGDGAILNPPLNHFPAGAACRATRPAGTSFGDGGIVCTGGNSAFCTCGSDSECTGGTNGRCIITGNGGPHCTYDDCSTASDCATGNSCACGDVNTSSFNACVPSNCRVDTDCGANGFCSPSLGSCGTYGGEYAGVYCHTAKDECTNDSDCNSSSGSGTGAAGFCTFATESGKWACQYTQCAG